jgi:hypothetical protein
MLTGCEAVDLRATMTGDLPTCHSWNQSCLHHLTGLLFPVEKMILSSWPCVVSLHERWHLFFYMLCHAYAIHVKVWLKNIASRRNKTKIKECKLFSAATSMFCSQGKRGAIPITGKSCFCTKWALFPEQATVILNVLESLMINVTWKRLAANSYMTISGAMLLWS